MNKGKEIPESEAFNYPIRIIVAGTRQYLDYSDFLEQLTDYLKFRNIDPASKDVIFISGMANGPDKLIVDVSESEGWQYVKCPADWDNLGRSAGYIRNAGMAKIATHLLAFWDGMSKGTLHMINIAKKANLDSAIILVELEYE